MGRRDKDDEEWKKVKAFVSQRDKNKCRFMRVISAKEAIAVQKIAPANQLRILDPAHIAPVGRYPHLVYEPRNIVLVCRWVHECLDNCKSPITGGNITQEEREAFWLKIVGSMTYGTIQEMKKNPDILLIRGEDKENG